MEIMAKVVGINTSDGMYNIMLNDKNDTILHFKVRGELIKGIEIGKTYIFSYNLPTI